MGKVAVVTGSNKGVGYAIVRGLCKKFDGDVVLTARDSGRGKEAVKELEKEGLRPKFHELDITSKASCEKLRDHLKQEYGGLDVLVNNAGIAYKNAAPEPPGVQAEHTIACNYYGTLNVCEALLPLLRPHARVANVSSRAGLLSFMTNEEARNRIKSPQLTIAELTQYMEKFKELCNDDKHKVSGYPGSTYSMSKIGMTALTFIYSRQMEKDSREDILINACCPGFVATDMTSNSKSGKTIDEGADTAIYLALLPPGTKSPRGELVAERKVIGFDSKFEYTATTK